MAKQVKNDKLIKAIALRLQKLRQDKGFTLEQLAYESDMELTQVHRVLNGQHDPGITTVQRLAKALGTTIGELLSGL
jgi:transcriptional regulator with XRE-family HTH domain